MRQDYLFLRWLLFPFSLLFGVLVGIKNGLYATGLLKAVRFNIPVIGVGNLSVGGAGKTPHVEYLIRLLRPYVNTSVMSRGFGRKSYGFFLVRPDHQSSNVGDEPLMFARKYQNVSVAVSESRSVGIPQLLQQRPTTQVVLLDDAFQHRSVSPHVNILLTEFNYPYYADWLLPTGTLREWRSSYRRADVIIVTKCPLTLTENARQEVIKQINPTQQQVVYFSAYQYHHPYSMYSAGTRLALAPSVSVLLVCGIARTEYLVDYLKEQVGYIDLLEFADHHVYRTEDLELIFHRFQAMPGEMGAKVILTT